MAQYLVSDIRKVCDDLKIVVPQRPTSAGSSENIAVENEDQAHAMAMVRFEGAVRIALLKPRVLPAE